MICDAKVTISSFLWSPPQPSSLVLIPVVSVAPGARMMLFIHAPPYSGDLGLVYTLSVLAAI